MESMLDRHGAIAFIKDNEMITIEVAVGKRYIFQNASFGRATKGSAAQRDSNLFISDPSTQVT